METVSLLTCLRNILLLDVSTTMIVRPGPVVDFLIENQGVRNPRDIDWGKVI